MPLICTYNHSLIVQLLAAAKIAVKAKAESPASKKVAAAATHSEKVDYGAAVLDALRNMNSKSSTQALTNVKAPGTINPVSCSLPDFSLHLVHLIFLIYLLTFHFCCSLEWALW